MIFPFLRCHWFYVNISPLIPLCEGMVTFFVVANFSLATFMDAGAIPKGLLRYQLCLIFFFWMIPQHFGLSIFIENIN